MGFFASRFNIPYLSFPCWWAVGEPTTSIQSVPPAQLLSIMQHVVGNTCEPTWLWLNNTNIAWSQNASLTWSSSARWKTLIRHAWKLSLTYWGKRASGDWGERFLGLGFWTCGDLVGRMDRLRQTRRVGGVQNGISTAVCVRAGLVVEDWFERLRKT